MFWQAYLPCLGSEEGVDLLAAECNVTAQFFQDLGDELEKATGVDVPGYTADYSERAMRVLETHPLRDLINRE